jgi:type II secretory pathway component GspD/PulD (secretin)
MLQRRREQQRPAETRREGDVAGRRRAGPRAAPGNRKTVVIKVNHLPASDTGKTISTWLQSEEDVTGQPAATVVPEVITNSIIVSGAPEQLERITSIVQELDQLSAQIHIKAMLVDLALSEPPEPGGDDAMERVSQNDFGDIVARLRKRGELRVLAQPQLLAADNQPAFLQSGGRVGRVTSVSNSSRGRSSAVQTENVGTILGVTSRVSAKDMVTLEIDLERSHLGPDDEGTVIAAGNGEAVRSPHIVTLSAQTTVSVQSGHTVILGGLTHHDGKRWGELWLLLQPTIVGP